MVTCYIVGNFAVMTRKKNLQEKPKGTIWLSVASLTVLSGFNATSLKWSENLQRAKSNISFWFILSSVHVSKWLKCRITSRQSFSVLPNTSSETCTHAARIYCDVCLSCDICSSPPPLRTSPARLSSEPGSLLLTAWRWAWPPPKLSGTMRRKMRRWDSWGTWMSAELTISTQT